MNTTIHTHKKAGRPAFTERPYKTGGRGRLFLPSLYALWPSLGAAIVGAVRTCRLLHPQRLVKFANEVALANVSLESVGAFDVQQPNSMFIPYGDYAHKKGKQRFDKAAAEKMANAFTASRQGLKRFFANSVPIYVGHPDVKEMKHLYPDSKAYGWLEGIQVENEGMRLQVKWSTPGMELIANAHYKYYSPYWGALELGGGVYQPAELYSVGLTNTPNIDVPALANEEDPAPSLQVRMAELLGVAVDADDDTLVNALKEFLTRRDEAANELATAKQEKESAESAKATAEAEKAQAEEEKKTMANDLQAAKDMAAEARQARLDLELQRLEKEGRILPAESVTHKARLMGLANEGEVTSAIDLLNREKVKVKTASEIQQHKKGEFLQGVEKGERQVKLANAIEAELAEVKKAVRNEEQAHELAWSRVRRKQPELFTNG